MRHLIGVVVLSISSIVFASCAPAPSDAARAAANPPPWQPAHPANAGAQGAVEQDAVTVAAKVVRVDAKKRLVTLEAPDGQRVTARVHARVNDLEALQAGDTVSATYYESVAYDVRPPGAAAGGNVGAERPTPLPGAIDARTVTLTSKIAAVDRQTGTVTLQAPDAEPVTVRINDPTALARVQAGDVVDITLTEAVAVTIEKAK